MSASAPPTVAIEIRQGQLPLVVARLRGPDVAAVLAELERRYGGSPGFFEDEPLLLDCTEWAGAPGASTPLEQRALIDGLRAVGLRPLAFCAAAPMWRDTFLAAGLVEAEAPLVGADRSGPAPAASAPVASKEPTAVAPTSALVVDRPLRSGQQVYARGRDLVVLAMVNPGSEVIADGHIHVYAPLRGRAIAGARGDTQARIFSLALEPELVSIAGIYQTAEKPWPDAVRGKPAQVRLSTGPEGDKLLLEPLPS